jgi:hypothetical protein
MPNRPWRRGQAVLVIAGVRLPRIHDLERPLALVSESGSPPPALVADAGWPTPWGVQFRYDEAGERLDHKAALAVCDAALGWAVDVLGS